MQKYGEVQECWADLADPSYLFNAAAEDALASILATEGALASTLVEFDHTIGDIETRKDKQFQYLTCNDAYYMGADGLTAALGRFTVYALAKGHAEPEGDGHRITVTGVAFFMRDGFDFEGDQSLGHWNYEDLTMTPSPWGNVENADFGDFRTRHGKGGDFWAYAVPRVLDGFGGHDYAV